MTRIFTVDGAKALLDMEPFIIIQIVWNGIRGDDDENYEKRKFVAYIEATNIPAEYDLDDLRKNLVEATEEIKDIQPGVSLYLCQMRFVDSGPYALYSRDDFLGAGESDPYWEITSAELMSYESLEDMYKEVTL